MPDEQKQALQGRAVAVVQSAIPVLDTAQFEHMHRVATAIGHGTLVPKHLIVPNNPQATIANCFRVVNQAVRWGFDPFAIIDETYAVGQKLGYSGKLVAGVLNAKAGLKQRLSYTYNDKTGDDLTITVHGTFVGEEAARTVTVRVGDAKTTHGMWVKDPKQKLIYTGATKWGRAHAPEVLLGIITDDDIERMKDMGDLVETAGGVYVPAAEVPARPARAAPKPEIEPFRVVGIDGVVAEHKTHGAAIDEFHKSLVQTGASLGPDRLEGLWESNGEILGQLRDWGLGTEADALQEAYVKIMAEADAKKVAAAQPVAKEEKAEPKKAAPAEPAAKAEKEPETPKVDHTANARRIGAEHREKGLPRKHPFPPNRDDLEKTFNEGWDGKNKELAAAATPRTADSVKPKLVQQPWKPNDEDPAPPSPMRQSGRWAPWMRWLRATLETIPLDQLEDFLSDKHWGQEWQYLGEKRAEIRQEFDLLLDQRRVPNG